MAKLSIVIPVYNVEDYLDECVESITSQVSDEGDDIEIILVDDGSKDNSGIKCDAWASKKKYIATVHKTNGGHSSARNMGLQKATGKYVAFVDSDDRLADGCIQKILNWIDHNHVDICFMEAIKFYPDGRQQPLGDSIEQEMVVGKPKDEVLAYIASRPKYPGSACTKLLRREFLLENALSFPTDRQHGEDLWLIMQCLVRAECYGAQNIPFYEYRQNREGSVSHKISQKSLFELGRFVADSSDLLSRHPENSSIRRLMNFVAYEFSIMLWHYSSLNTTELSEAKALLEKYKWVLRYGTTKRLRLIGVLVKLFGIHLVSKLLNFYMNRR